MHAVDLEQEQIELIVAGQKDRPVLIGTSIKIAPVEPKMTPGKSYRQVQKDAKQWEKDQNKIASGALRLDQFDDEYKHDVLYSEKYFNGSKWTEKINAAFIVGAIKSEREIRLVTARKFYTDMGPGFLNNTTFWELLALKKCGYKFYLENDGSIVISRGNEIADNYREIVNNVFTECQEVTNIIDASYYDFQNNDMLKKYVEKYKSDISELIGEGLLARVPANDSDHVISSKSEPEKPSSPEILERSKLSVIQSRKDKPQNNHKSTMIGSIFTGMVLIAGILTALFRGKSETLNVVDENLALTPAHTPEESSRSLVQSMHTVTENIYSLSETQLPSSKSRVFSPSPILSVPKSNLVVSSNIKTKDLLGVAQKLYDNFLASSNLKEAQEIQQKFLHHIDIVEGRLLILKSSEMKDKLSKELVNAQKMLPFINEIEKMPTKTNEDHISRP